MLTDELLKPIISACGEKTQKIKAMEEMNELNKELCKNICDAQNISNITEKMADVIIMISQMVIVFDNGKDIKKIINNKIERTYKRLGLEGLERLKNN